MDVVNALKSCLDEAEFPCTGGNKPLPSCGTRFISHKVAAMNSLVEGYGAYVSYHDVG